MGLVLPVVVAAIGVWIAFSIVVWATGRDSLRDDTPAGPPPGLDGPEPVTEAAIGAVRFDTGARGYRTEQVDAALHRLAWEIGRRDERLAELERAADAAAAPAPAVEETAPAPSEPAPGDAEEPTEK